VRDGRKRRKTQEINIKKNWGNDERVTGSRKRER
jgi:hypothetical protein